MCFPPLRLKPVGKPFARSKRFIYSAHVPFPRRPRCLSIPLRILALAALSFAISSSASATFPCDHSLLLPEASKMSGLELAARHRMYRWNGQQIEDFAGTATRVPNSGISNRGIFRLQPENGAELILRVTPQAPLATPPLQLFKQIEGMWLQEAHGGPKLFDIGTWVEDNQKPHFFVLMECVFCNQRSLNLKDLAYGSLTFVPLLEQQGKNITGNIGDQLARVFEDRILPLDPDFLLSDSGEVRWIDGERWETVRDLRIKTYELAYAFWVVFEYVDRAMSALPGFWPYGAKRFLSGFFDRIQNSPHLLPEEKNALISQIIQGKASQDYLRLDSNKSIPEEEALALHRTTVLFLRGQ
jgi:hypothetical protein